MYRMIRIDNQDSDYQRILWRNDTSEEIKDYRLLTVTFGTASAPYLAVRTLMQLADDEGDKYPEAARILRKDFYVDDVMSGADSLEQAVSVSQNLKRLLQLGGFELKKWLSNSSEFMKTIHISERSSKAHLDFKVDGTVKALGILWNLSNDAFEYNLNLPVIGNVITKRSILSDIQRLFDPLGWIAPCLVMAKILIQRLWLEKVDWDEALNSTLTEKWFTIRSDLENVNDISINRWMGTLGSNKDCVEIHGFSDASMQAYGAVVYCRITHPDNPIKTSIIAARTKVAPLKTISLPRLELCGALLLSRLLKQIGLAMRIPASQIYAWTDSSIVISWLAGDSNKWKPFVANRVVEITSNVNSNQWYHVQSQDNPADVASRGMLVANLKKCDMWWNGPQWLQHSKIQFTRPNVLPTDLEVKKKTLQTLIVTNNEENKLTMQFNDFDTLTSLLRIITYCRRFLKQKLFKDNLDKIITTEELELSLQTCIKRAQEEEFNEEIESIKRKKRVKKTSKIKSLDPYLDEHGVLRVGGRLRNADLTENTWKEAQLQFDGEVSEMLANDGTQWHFIPAYSPTFGGLWEAGVKSIKYHLKRVLSTNLTFEEMTTVLCEIEACLNSRPLCPMDDDSMQPLTPGHFLIAEAPVNVPDVNLKTAKVSNLTRWQYTQRLLNDFWSRWQKEYLTRLQQRPKWLKREKEFKVGDIVLIKQDSLPPGKWFMGRITDKHPGPDGFTRVYSVKSGTTITKRSVTKLCALPVDTSD
ncbi:uncharacterized protein LOC142985871 [Anticarsia gemmatalis]|uniref:uncharacterized protein LOC142985871 n=1 Tax=Anticarsia gemmatalis TaxID=129554 RepID=UPI003F7738F6